MTLIIWTKTKQDQWKSSPMDNGLYGVIDRTNVGGDAEYWGYTALDGDIPAGPGELSEVFGDLDDAQDRVNGLLLEEWSETLSI